MSSRRPEIHFILLLVTYYCSTHTAANGGITTHCLPDHAASLLQLKRSFFHNPNLSSWQHDTDCCHWEGVGCDRDSGRVITLDLSDRNLQSISGLSPALFNLTSLRNLSLCGNDFGLTSLPNFGFEQLIELQSLDLFNTRLFGQIPIGIAHLENLLTLDLSGNYMHLREPSFQTLIAKLSNLRYLYLDEVDISSSGSTWSVALADSVPLLQSISLSYCALNGPIHQSFSRLRSLAMINLADNEFSGKVPEFFAEFSLLSGLDRSYNNFEGPFPTNIFQPKNLRYLLVSNNLLLFMQLSDFPPGNKLEVLDLRETNLSDAMPEYSFVHLNSLKFLSISNIGSPEQPTPSIANLTSLDTLWLSGCGIQKPMLSWIGRLENLTELMLDDYNFSGPIPWWIKNCTSLTSLSLFDCGLSGAIPSWIGNLAELSYLDLSMNRLSGVIPKSLFALPALRIIILNSNQLYGPLEDIPYPLSSPLSLIDLGFNQLTGPIPKSIYQLKHLEHLSLDSNRLSGTLELSSFWRLRSLTFLSLSNNMLSVVMDEEGVNVILPPPNINSLYLESCNLTEFPGQLKYLDKVSKLDLSNNKIKGVIPSWVWVNWKDHLQCLDLSRNMFTTLEKSPSLVHMPYLSVLDISFNRLQGTIPIPVLLFPGIVLDYSNNNFSSIEPDFGKYIRNFTYLNLSTNKLNGLVPSSICSASELSVIDLSYNNFNGPVPSCLIENGKFMVLNLRQNKFRCIMPENIREGCKLQTLNLNGNQIEGKLPRSLSNCKDLELLDVGNNQIVGSFPSWLGILPQLQVLVLRSNLLNGTTRGNKGDDHISNHFSSLQILDLASNNFSGNLPKGWFDEMTAMIANINDFYEKEGDTQVLEHSTRSSRGFYKDTITLTFKGGELTFTKILSTFNVIDVSNNSFGGHIPESLGRLVSLHGLNMSYNNFMGQIPSPLSELSRLESLDLSWNRLSGEIPQDLTHLTSLECFNLSYNNLSGRIPQDNQFLSFPNSSFEGNFGLCGLPLSKQCGTPASIAPSAVPPPESNSLWQDKLGVILLFAFVGLGFGVGFTLSLMLRLFCRIEGWLCKH